MIGNGTLFGLQTAFWLLAYIQRTVLQKIYKHTTTWSMPIAWGILLSSLVEFIRGGTQGDISKELQLKSAYASTRDKEYMVLPGSYTNLLTPGDNTYNYFGHEASYAC